MRSGGKRLEFLERMCGRGKITLGLGEFKRILPVYSGRQEEADILKYLTEENTPLVPKNVIVAAPSTAGKTRTALELTYKLDPAFVLIWPKDLILAGNSMVDIPKIKTDVVVFADDISITKGEGKPSINPALQGLLRMGEKFKLIATHRLEGLPKELADAEVFELTEISPHELAVFFRIIADEGKEEIQKVIDRYAGHPGNVVANLDAKREHWRNLPESCKRILQAEKFLIQEGVRFNTTERILGAIADLWGLKGKDIEFDNCMEKLQAQGFINISGSDFRIYSGYRDSIVSLPKVSSDPHKRLLDGFRKRKDHEAFLQIALFWGQEYSSSYQQNARLLLRRVIEAYIEALRFYIPEKMPENYSAIQNNLGSAYRSLASYEDPKKNLKTAIAAYEEALKSTSLEEYPLDYAATQNNLGSAYQDLSDYEEPVKNLKLAMANYERALRIFTPAITRWNYVTSQNNLGNVYSKLANYVEPVENLRAASEAFHQALRYTVPEIAPLDYATTQDSLGSAYVNLSGYEETLKNLHSAISSYEQSLRFRKAELIPIDYAASQNNLGSAYAKLAEHQDSEKNLNHAISSYEQALRFRTPEADPLNYSRTQNNLGNVYGALAVFDEPMKNLRAAVVVFKNALRFLTPVAAPFDYAMTQNNLGIAYGNLALYEETLKNISAAIAAYKQALRFRTPESSPLDYASTENNLGMAYLDLAEQKEKKSNLERARGSFMRALNVFEKHLPPNHHYIEMIKGRLKKLE